MNNLFTAIMSKTTTSSLSTDVGGRIFLDYAPDGTAFPYIIFFIVSGNPERTFSEHFTNTLIQFSLFSASPGATEITTMYGHLKSLFDECSLTITGSKLIIMKEQNLTTIIEDVLVKDATVQCRHWACDYEIMTSLN